MDEIGEHIEDLHKNLKLLISQGKSPDAALAELKRDQERLYSRYAELLEQRLSALNAAHAREVSGKR